MIEISVVAQQIAASRQQGIPADEGELWHTNPFPSSGESRANLTSSIVVGAAALSPFDRRIFVRPAEPGAGQQPNGAASNLISCSYWSPSGAGQVSG
jgi:hypothetical protein